MTIKLHCITEYCTEAILDKRSLLFNKWFIINQSEREEYDVEFECVFYQSLQIMVANFSRCHGLANANANECENTICIPRVRTRCLRLFHIFSNCELITLATAFNSGCTVAMCQAKKRYLYRTQCTRFTGLTWNQTAFIVNLEFILAYSFHYIHILHIQNSTSGWTDIVWVHRRFNYFYFI